MISRSTITHVRNWKYEKAIKDITDAVHYARNTGHSELANRLQKLVNEMKGTHNVKNSL